MLKIIKKYLLDLIFPQFCIDCGKEGSWLCDSCKKEILPVSTQTCPDCGRISRFGKYCLKDRKNKYLAGIIVASYYQEGAVKELIHNFKYNHMSEIGISLGDLLSLALKENIKLGKDLLLSPVPLFYLRKSQRGYNQAEILAKVVAAKLKLEKNDYLLVKKRQTKPQVSLEGKKRRKNLKKSFFFNKKYDVSNRTIILVDDVSTTGTTLNECAKVVKNAGAKKVWGLVVARG